MRLLLQTSVLVTVAIQQPVLGDRKTNFLFQEKAESCLVFSTLNFTLQFWETSQLDLSFCIVTNEECIKKKPKTNGKTVVTLLTLLLHQTSGLNAFDK